MIERKIILLGRHGSAPQKPTGGSEDWLEIGVVNHLYHEVGVPLKEEIGECGIIPERTFLRHTNKNRTKTTGQAVLTGVFANQYDGTSAPTSEEDLKKFGEVLDKINTSEDPRFNIGKPYNINMDVYLRTGSAGNVNYALQNPDSIRHQGKTIESGRSLKARTAAGVHDNIALLTTEDLFDMGVIVSHGTVAEYPVLALVNTSRGRSPAIDNVEEIGGPIGMSEFAILRVDKDKRSGLYTAELELKDQKYDVDLQKL